MKCNGHLIPCPLTLPNESGISTFMACEYTAITNTTIVAIIPASMSIAVCGSPADKLWNSAGSAPVATPGFVGEGRGDSNLMNRLCDTPAAINRLTPDPKPHLVITSSMNIIRIPPKISWKISISSIRKYSPVPAIAAGGASPPMNT